MDRLVFAKGEVGGRGMDWEFGISKCKLFIIYRMDKQQDLNVEHMKLYSISCDKP